MEGRPPPFDPDDDLDFDFEASRRRRQERIQRGETGERPAAPRPDTGEERFPDTDTSGDERGYESDPGTGDDPFDTTSERPAGRRGRSRKGRFTIPAIGKKRRSAAREERRAGATEAAPGATERSYETGETGFDTGESDYGTGESAYSTSERAAPTTGIAQGQLDDPFLTDTAERRARREHHHRDLPAKVRRRQAIAVGVIALVVLGGGFLLLSGGGGGGDEEEGLPLKKLVGQTIVGRVGKDGANPELLKQARKGLISGVIVETGGDQALAQEAVAQLQDAAAAGDNPPLLTMVDQEGGDIKVLPGPPDTSPADLGRSGDTETARGEGEKTGAYLKPLGIDVNLAPVLDVELPQTADTIRTRTFSDDADRVADLGSAFIDGIQSQQVAATAKHFPGLGPATLNTDFSAVTVRATQEQLDEALLPFQAAVDAGVDLVMMSSAAYPTYAGANPGEGKVKPAAFAEPIVQGLLRQQLGFNGVVITDDLESIAIKTLTNRDIAAVAALRAGCDLALYSSSANGATQGLAAVVKAIKGGKLDQAIVQQAYDRVQTLKEKLASAG